MPKRLLLLALLVILEVIHQVLDLLNLCLSVCVNNLREVLHETEISAHRVGESSELAQLGNQRNLVASPAVFVDEQGLVRIVDCLVVPRLVVLTVAGHSPLLVESSFRRLCEVDSIDLVGLLVVLGDHSAASESLLNGIVAILVAPLSILTDLVHVLDDGVGANDLEADVNIEQTALLLHNQPRVEARPDLDVVGVQAVSVRLVEGLLADGLEAKRAHHAVEEDLQEVHVVSVVLLHDLDPFNSHRVLDTVMLSTDNGQLCHFLERKDAEAPVDVELEMLLDLVAAEFEDSLAHRSGVVGDFGLKLDGVFVDTSNVFGVEVDAEEV